MDPCDNIMRQLETHVGRPKAKPEALIELVQNTPSGTVKAPRHLSPTLRRHMAEIAELHGGKVPLHGRLFAQWLHHAFPQECPYPHVSGTTAPVSPDEWMKKSETTEATDEEMKRHALPRASAEELSIAMAPEAQAEALPWITVEELIVPRAQDQQASSGRSLRLIGMVALAASLLQLKRSTKGSLLQFQCEKSEKCFV